MTNPCDCEACTNKQNHLNNQDKGTKSPLSTAWFKENTLKIADLVEKVLDNNGNSGKKSKKASVFRLTLSEFNDSEGYALEYGRNISMEEFSMLLEDLFGLEVDLFQEKDEYTNGQTVENDVVVFKSLDEVINYLTNKQEDDQ